ncbi:thiamine-triphosphatase-like [Diadema setosum]|uniref:thiamine-triphosphatase-like n=1 Tax=Diadema setosum TaxID=31175 RepID=UPI003B3B2283
MSSKGGKMVEIERKFLVVGDTSAKIVNAGGTFSGEVTLSDSYFDDENYSLTKRDYWLRCRNSKWELKMPPKNRQDDSDCTQYQEVTTETDIVAQLSAILSTENADVVNGNEQCTKDISESQLVETFVKRRGLEPFAVFTSNRKNYSFQGGISVTVDEADFGFQVGEIEMMVEENDGEMISKAIADIHTLAESLGMQDLASLCPDQYLGLDVTSFISNCM